MERSAVYRRALAPIMLLAGALGTIAAGIGLVGHFESIPAFNGIWTGTAVLAVAGAFLIARKQALRDQEAFWSPPTRRVAIALVPPLIGGLAIGAFPVFFPHADSGLNLFSSITWMVFYGCALHSAGFFIPRGIRLFGWAFITCGCILFYASAMGKIESGFSAYWVMGFFFGVLHLLYGVYLYSTEKGNKAA